MSMQSHPIKVLLIDDDEDDYIIRDLLSNLPSIEFVLKWVADYGAALDAILSGKFDICLLDYRLKERNGPELMQEAVGRGAITPIVFLTSRGHSDLDLEAISKGAADWLTKGELSATLLERSIRLAMERQRKREELIKAKMVIQALSECNHAVIHIKDEVELLRAICRIVVDVGGYRMAWVGYAEEDRDQAVTPVASYGYEKDYPETVKATWKDAERGRGPTGTCICTGIPSIIHSVGAQAEFAPWKVEASKLGYASVIGLPLLLDRRKLGALTIYSSETDAFDTEEVEFLVKLSSNLSYGIGVLRLRKAQMQAEELLKEANRELEGRVEERTAELLKANVELRKEVEERRWAEQIGEGLRRQNEIILNSAGEGILGLGPEGRHTFANPAATRLLGYKADELIGRKGHGLYHHTRGDGGTYLEENCPIFQAFRYGKFCQVTEEVFWRKDGTSFPVIYSSAPVIEEGEVVGAVVTFRDISERKQAEQKATQLAAIVQSSDDVIIGKNPDGIITSWNRGAEMIYGYAESEVIGKQISMLLPPMREDEVPQILAKIKLGEHIEHYETVRRRKDGRDIWMSLTVSPVRNLEGMIVAASTIGRDITERKQAEEALRESEKRYKQLLESVTDYVFTVQVQGNRPLATVHGPGCAAVTGFRSEDYEADPYLWYQTVYEQDRDAVRDQAARILSGEEVSPLEHRIIHRDGSIRWVRNTPVQHYDQQRELIAYDGIITNITERKQAEEALRESDARLKIAMDLAKVAQWEYDVKTGMYSFDDQFYALYGTTSQHEGGPLMTAEAYTRKFIPSEESHVLAEEIAKVLATTDPNFTDQLEHRIIRADGEERHITVRYGVVCDQRGRVVKIRGANQDVTERKIAEDALRESEGRLRVFIEHSPASLAMFDREMRYLSASPRWLSEHKLGARDLIGLSHYKVFPEIPEYWREVHRRGLEGEVVRADSDRFERADGSVQWRRWEVQPWLNQAGGVAGIVIFSEDITARKQGEEALRESEERFRRAMEATSDGLWDWDVASGSAYYSPGYFRMLGYEPEEFSAKADTWLELIHPDDRERALAANEACIRNAVPSFSVEFRMLSRDENWRWILGRGKAIIRDTGGRALRMIGTHIDITDRKRSEEVLRENQSRLDLALRSARMGVWSIDLIQNKRHFDDQVCHLLGLDPAKFAGTAEEFYKAVHPDDREMLTAALARSIEQDVLYEKEYRVVWPDGSVHYNITRGKLFRDEIGQPVRMNGLIWDITEHKRAEKEKKELESKLRQSQKLEAIGTLAGGIAHDFNNILQPMMGYTEMALKELSPSNPVREDLEQVLDSSRRAKELVRQILAISRSIEEQQRIPIDISSIIKEALKLLRSSLPTSIEIRQNIQTGVAQADATQIHQVLMNLCTNAAHAMDDKGILEVRLSPVDLSESDLADQLIVDLKPGPHLRLTVSDTGCGIDANTMERIFDPYFTTKEVGKGSGLGLAVVHGIVKRHEGAIAVRSEPGKGTTFSVYIPRVDVQAEATMQVDDLPPRGSERILLVDDEPTVIKMGTRLLERLGYKVTSQTDSVNALEIFRLSPDEFDLVITDYTMPKLTGLDFAREARQIRPDLPVLLCTGFSEKITPDSVKELGMELLMKPYGMREISEVVRKILDARKEC